MNVYMIGMIISGIFNAILSGSLIVTLKTLKSKTEEAKANAKIASANADSLEIRNVSDLTKLLIESTSEFEKKLDEYRQKLDDQRCEIRSMKNALIEMRGLLNQLMTLQNITPQDIEKVIIKMQDITK